MTEEMVEKHERLWQTLDRDRWNDPLRGGLPQVPTKDSLPTASADFAFRLLGLRDASTDKVYVCLKQAGTWTWVQVA